MALPKNSFPATVAIVLIFAGAILGLSGLCTGIFAWEAEAGRGGDLMPTRWYHAVIWGSFAFIPAGLFFWAALRQWRRGNNKISGALFLIGGLGGVLLCLPTIINIALDIIRETDYRAQKGLPLPTDIIFWGIIIPLIGALLSAWFIYVGIKILRNLGPTQIPPETFE